MKNLVSLTVSLSLNEQAKNQTYFGNDFHPYTMKEIVNTIGSYYKVNIPTVPSVIMTVVAYGFGFLKLFGLKVPIYPFRLKNIKANYCYDIQKSIEAGYLPTYDLKSGINETLDWYESNKKF